MVTGPLTRRAVIALIGASGLAGCGFRPVYMRTRSGDLGVAQRELASIAVDVIADRPGQLLRQDLQQRLAGSDQGAPELYSLNVSYSIAGEGIGVQADNSVTRTRLIAHAGYTLRRSDTARTLVTTGAAQSVDDFNIIDQQLFAADLENEAANGRLANAIADQITLQLATFFKRHALPVATVIECPASPIG